MEPTSQPDWQLLMRFLPEGWEEQARESRAFRRSRRIKSPGDLLRLVLMHGGLGLSLQRAVEMAGAVGVAALSKVALWYRMRAAGPWLEWLVGRLLAQRVECPAVAGYQVRAVDATHVTGPKQGVHLRLHYGFDLLRWSALDLKVTDQHVAEGFEHFAVRPGDLLLADRAYARAKGIGAAKRQGGDVLVRLGRTSLKLYDQEGVAIEALPWLQAIPGYEPVERGAQFRDPATDHWVTGRLCALRRSEPEAEKARARLERAARRQGQQVRASTLQAAGYLCLFTTAPADRLPAVVAFELYRARWQIELAFKRLKSLLHADHLRDTSAESARYWLYAKMLYALLLHAYLDEAGAFSPWGYPLSPRAPASGPPSAADPDPRLGPHRTRSPRLRGRPPGPLTPRSAHLAPHPPRPRRRTAAAQPSAPSRSPRRHVRSMGAALT